MATVWDAVQRRIEAHYGKAYGPIINTLHSRDDH
jgi:hypothetical protein